MNDSFWHKCWENNTIGFHQEAVHLLLGSHFLPLIKNKTQNIFVPLCGKSLDMWWLSKYGKVVGTDISAIACRDFFLDRNIDPKIEVLNQFTCYSHENISLFQGDFFKLEDVNLPKFDWIYDRAAIIAMPASMQKNYVDKLCSFMGMHTRIFLLSLEFPQEELSGPPFSTTATQIESLFEGYACEKISEESLSNKRFAQRTFNVSSLTETLYIIGRK